MTLHHVHRWLAEIDQDALEKISLKTLHLESHHIFWLKFIAGIGVVLVVINILFGKQIRTWVNRKKPVKREKLKVEKIILDENNARQGVRVMVAYNLVFENARTPEGKRAAIPEDAQTIDMSLRGLAYLSKERHPVGTNITFRVMESEVAASPILTGTVVAMRPWNRSIDEAGQQEGLSLMSVRLKNLSGEANGFVRRVVTDAERNQLVKERTRREDRDTE